MLKPSLIHGDCWDGNTTMDMRTGECFVFDACSFYGHNEYDTGNWRAPRHKLSNKEYIRNYKRHYPMSEPGKYLQASWCAFDGILTRRLVSGRLGLPQHSVLAALQHRQRDLRPRLKPETSVSRTGPYHPASRCLIPDLFVTEPLTPSS